MTEEQVFLAALDLPNGADRAAYLDEVCGQNNGLRCQVEELLAAHERSGQFLDEAAAEQMAARRQSSTDQTIAHNAEGDDAMADGKKTSAAPSDDGPEDLHFLSPSSRPDSLGRLGHYEMLQVLGKGGFGIVFRAFDETLQRVVAVKVMAPQIASLSPARKRFLREARSSAQVRHENVVQIYEVGERPLPYLAMEFIPGETLQQKLDRSGPLEVPEVLRIGRQVAEGLAAAHACDLIHRDIKPANVLIEGGPQQRVKITDFGLARAADDASISQSGLIAGTPMYMAPEQALGHKLDQRADLFSLGSVLYQMVSGRPPFRAPSALAVLKRVAEEPPRPIPEIIPETPAWLCKIIAKLHAKNPDDRYQSAREIADVLADCEGQLKANAKLKDFSRIPQSKPVSRQRLSGVLLVVLLLAGLLALGTIGSGAVIAALWLFASPQSGGQPSGNPEVTSVVATSGADPAPVVAAKQNPLPPTFTNGIGMEFVIVPKGKSWLGGDKDKLGDQEVVIPADFYLGKYEVTQEEWEKVMGENPSSFSRTGEGSDAVKDISDADLKRFPVDNVSWDQCQQFVAKLNQREKEAGWVYRLPKLTEWEYACRGGPMVNKADSAFDYYLAKPTNTLLPEDANFDKVMNRACKVGSYQPNRLGLFDMHGNVQEWCQDSAQATTDDGKRFRGGSFRIGQCKTTGVAGGTSTFRGDDLGLRLARVPSGAPSLEAKSHPTDSDHRAAEYVLSIGGTVRVDGSDREIRAQGELPTGTFRLTYVNLDQNKQVTDSGLAAFKDCKNLTYLRLYGCTRITDAGLAHFKDCKNLTYLELEGVRVTDAALAVFAGYKDLTVLELNNTQVTAAGLVYLKDCKKLTEIGFLNTPVTDAGLAHLKDCKDLTWLDLRGTKVTDAGLAYFKDCEDLTTLMLNNTAICNTGLAVFKDCKNLTKLTLRGTSITDAGLALVKDHKKLEGLELDSTKVTDAGLAHLVGLTWLTELRLNGTKVTDGGLAHFKGMPLRFLWIYNTGIAELSPLQGMPLEEIRLTPKNITRGLDILRDMKSLKTIGIDYNHAWPAAEFWERYDKGEFTK